MSQQITFKYRVAGGDGLTIKIVDTLAGAVYAAASDDRYGAMFERDDAGNMRLYSTSRHWGNNICVRDDCIPFTPASALQDDDAAIDEVAKKVYLSGCYHSRHSLSIDELTFVDGVLSCVDATPVEQSYADCCDPEEVTLDQWRATLLR
jgi:hypothetical protein